MITAISLIDASKRVVDYGNGKNRKGVWLNSIHLDDNIRAAQIGFHAFTGNDYVSSIFKRGKQGCFKVMKQCDEFINAFRLLGEDWELNSELTVALESFACHLYRYKDTDIIKVRKKMIYKKFVKEEEVMDLSLSPPCQSTLYLLILRSNDVTRT